MVLPGTRTSRITDLLEVLQLTDRSAADDFENIMKTPVDYDRVDEILNKKITDSKEYIASVLKAEV